MPNSVAKEAILSKTSFRRSSSDNRENLSFSAKASSFQPRLRHLLAQKVVLLKPLKGLRRDTQKKEGNSKKSGLGTGGLGL